jgi:hypothetical protein
MRFLCLAYGKEEDWIALPEARRAELWARDEVLRQRGDLVAVVGEPTVLRAWDGPVTTTSEAYAVGPAPLVGFSIVEAEDVDEAVSLVAGTPCAVAGGAIEVRPILDLPS